MTKTLYIYEAELPGDLISLLCHEMAGGGVFHEKQRGHVRCSSEGAAFELAVLGHEVGPFGEHSIVFRVDEETPENVYLAWAALHVCSVLRSGRVWLGTYTLESLEAGGVIATSCTIPGIGVGCIVKSEDVIEL